MRVRSNLRVRKFLTALRKLLKLSACIYKHGLTLLVQGKVRTELCMTVHSAVQIDICLASLLFYLFLFPLLLYLKIIMQPKADAISLCI